jgi:hypothetical protein
LASRHANVNARVTGRNESLEPTAGGGIVSHPNVATQTVAALFTTAIGEFVMNMPSKFIAVALMAAAAPWLGSPATALPIGSPLALHNAVAPSAELVRYRGRGLLGAGIGLAAGAIIGGAILGATQPFGYYGYDNGPYGYGGYEPAYVVAPSYGYGPVYRQRYVAGGGDVGYCMQRYRSYDPASGTYLGFDGLRHPC